MKETEKISLCITTFNRVELTIQSFIGVLKDDRVSEIVIYDDGSSLDVQLELRKEIEDIGNKKINFYVSDNNEGMSLAKKTAIGLAENKWCYILDSDNRITSASIDALYHKTLEWENDVIYCPSYAYPNFNYTMYEAHLIDSEDVKIYMQDSKFLKLLNTCNYLVNKDYYLSVYAYDPEIKGADTIWHNYNHLKSGGALYVVKDLHYNHRVHEGSGWQQHANENRMKAKEIQKLIMEL